MKKIILLLLLSFAAIVANAQYFISCDKRTHCTWNDYTDKYEDCESWEDNSLFEINENATMFTHTTSSMKSTYYIRSQKLDVNSDGEEIMIWDVVSDAGNKYTYVVCLDGKYINAAGDDFIVTFRIKKAFK